VYVNITPIYVLCLFWLSLIVVVDVLRFVGDTVDRGAQDAAALQPAYRERLTTRPGSGGWRRDPHVVLRHEGQNRPAVGGSRVISSLLDNVLDNSDRRQYGMGWVGRMFG
jgi:hypothetical protein